MLPSPIWPLAEHVSCGQNWCDASSGFVGVGIFHRMPMDACFFKSSLLFHWLVESYPLFSVSKTCITSFLTALSPFHNIFYETGLSTFKQQTWDKICWPSTNKAQKVVCLYLIPITFLSPHSPHSINSLH